MYTVVSPDPPEPDSNPRGEVNYLILMSSILHYSTSATRGELLTPDPNECNSNLTSGTRGIYPYLYIDEESGPCAKFEDYGPVYTGPDKFGTGPRLGPDRPCVHTGPPGTGTMSNFGPLSFERLGTDPIRSRSGPVPNLSDPV